MIAGNEPHKSLALHKVDESARFTAGTGDVAERNAWHSRSETASHWSAGWMFLELPLICGSKRLRDMPALLRFTAASQYAAALSAHVRASFMARAP
jgi:hypothetical protein